MILITVQILKLINSQKIKFMNIALIGYGRMGHEIETVAINRGHRISLIIDNDNLSDFDFEHTRGIDVAIEFTTPETAFENLKKCFSLGIPVVCGTTGWLADYEKAVTICRENNGSFIHSSNFSPGVNILFKLNVMLARFVSAYPDYKPFIEEIHHTKKLDAPSGTAISLANGICTGNPAYKGWCFETNLTEKMVPVNAIREGVVPGTHIIEWDSPVDKITLRHEAKNRKGLALGSVIAAEYIHSRKGVFTMDDVLGF
jgi:4-hydroxy-tetrahydrodipicolinate reductase